MMILITKCHPDAILPRYATKHSAGADLFAVEWQHIIPDTVSLVRTGLKVALPPGWCLKILPRSGLSIQYPGYITNAPGLIDADYRGEIKVLVHAPRRAPISIRKGDRIAQCTLEAVDHMHFTEVRSLPQSDRGQGGLGSTGV